MRLAKIKVDKSKIDFMQAEEHRMKMLHCCMES